MIWLLWIHSLFAITEALRLSSKIIPPFSHYFFGRQKSKKRMQGRFLRQELNSLAFFVLFRIMTIHTGLERINTITPELTQLCAASINYFQRHTVFHVYTFLPLIGGCKNIRRSVVVFSKRRRIPVTKAFCKGRCMNLLLQNVGKKKWEKRLDFLFAILQKLIMPAV